MRSYFTRHRAGGRILFRGFVARSHLFSSRLNSSFSKELVVGSYYFGCRISFGARRGKRDGALRMGNPSSLKTDYYDSGAQAQACLNEGE
jgi:hypothetical protein